MDMTIGHRPKLATLSSIPAAHIVSLLLPNEDSAKLSAAVIATGKHSIVVPFKVRDADVTHIREAADKVALLLAQNESVFVHCSAGLHRTGTFAYAVLRRLDFPHDQAVGYIRCLRPETAQAMTPFIEWAQTTLI